jgi:hypothetical protein
MSRISAVARGCGHLQVERQRDLGLQPGDVLIANVTAIFAQMRGDAIRAGLGRQARRAHRVGMCAAACVADGGDVVNVHAKTDAGGRMWHGSFARACSMKT